MIVKRESNRLKWLWVSYFVAMHTHSVVRFIRSFTSFICSGFFFIIVELFPLIRSFKRTFNENSILCNLTQTFIFLNFVDFWRNSRASCIACELFIFFAICFVVAAVVVCKFLFLFLFSNSYAWVFADVFLFATLTIKKYNVNILILLELTHQTQYTLHNEKWGWVAAVHSGCIISWNGWAFEWREHEHEHFPRNEQQIENACTVLIHTYDAPHLCLLLSKN